MTYTQEQANRLHVLLMEAMGEYVEHQSWRCEHPPHYYLTERPEGGYEGCPCGLDEFRKRVTRCLVENESAALATKDAP